MKAENKKIEIIDLLRATLATIVVAFHVVKYYEFYYRENLPLFIKFISDNGKFSVDFFFVISGFILMETNFNQKYGSQAFKVYISKRFIKIFPPYIPLSVFFILIFSIYPEISHGKHEKISIISSIFLIPTDGGTSLGVAWSLISEMIFYYIFSFYFLFRKIFVGIIAAWGSIIVFYIIYPDLIIATPIFAMTFSPINIEFIGGMICAYIWHNINIGPKIGIFLFFFGTMILVIIIYFELTQYKFTLTIPFSLILLGGCYIEKGTKIKIPKILTFLGDASYATYLIHTIAISLLLRCLSAFDKHIMAFDWSAWCGLVIISGTAMGVLLGVAYHKLYGVPVGRFLRQWMLPQPKSEPERCPLARISTPP